MKKVIIGFLLLVSIGLLLLMGYMNERYVLGIESTSCEHLQKMIKNKPKMVCQPETIRMNSHKVFYDEQTGTIFLSQSIEDSTPSGLLETTKGTLYFEEKEELRNIKQSMEQGIAYHLYQVFEQGYCQYSVRFIGVPMMKLTIADTYQKEINFEDKTVYQSVLEVVDPYGQDLPYQKTTCEFYRRGLGSYERDYAKKNYKLNVTGEKLALLGMRKDDDWLLNGLLDDAGLVHNQLCYKLWEKLTKEQGTMKTNSSKMEYVALFVDETYMGIYGLMERIDRKQLQLSDRDKLYKVRSPRAMEERDYSNEMQDGIRPIAECKYPQKPSKEDWEPLKQWNECFRHGWIDHIDEAYSLIDYDNAIDYNLFLLLICGVDNTMNNSYLVAAYDEALERYQIKRIPWDMNLTFGNDLTDTPETNWIIWNESRIMDTSTWTPEMSFLYSRDEKKVAEDLYKHWITLRQHVFTRENIDAILDEQYEYLQKTGAYQSNDEWYPYDFTSWNNQWIFEFIDQRIAFLDQYFERMYRASVGEPVYVIEGVDYTREFNAWYYWYTNYETLYGLFDGHFDEMALLEHYARYGKQAGMAAKDNNH